MSIGSRVRARRKALNLSQEALARRAGVTLNAVSQLERGISSDPHYSTLSGLASALDMSVAELIGELEPAVPLAEAPPFPGPSADEAVSEEERRAQEYALIRLWADLIKSFRDRFVGGFVDALPENPHADTVVENTTRLEEFASEFSSMEKALIEAGAAEFFMRYVSARQVRATGRGLPDLYGESVATREEADEILKRTPADVVTAIQDISAAQGDIRMKLAKARAWVSEHNEVEKLAELDQRVEQWEEDLRTKGLLEAPA